jgi:C4-type Zn-finger protein
MINAKIKPIQGIQICPFCGGSIEYAGISSGHIFPGIHTGQMYMCTECGYQGSFIIEVDTPDEVNKIKEALKTKDGNIEIPAFSYPEKWRWIWRIILLLIIAVFVLGIIGIL